MDIHHHHRHQSEVGPQIAVSIRRSIFAWRKGIKPKLWKETCFVLATVQCTDRPETFALSLAFQA